MEILEQKFNKLIDYLKEQKSVAVAYSAGVDSTFLLKCSQIALDDKVIALSANLNSFPARELQSAKEFCAQNNIKHIIVDINELNIEGFCNNPKNRCYLCKKHIFKELKKIADDYGATLLDGSNVDDDFDYRPGSKALAELNIKSPLKIANLSKKEIRILSEKLNLKTFNKPSFACLSSRIPYGDKITKEKLKMIEKSEQFLFDLGIKQLRVRICDKTARIEVERRDFEKIINNKDEIIKNFKSNGFTYVTLDIEGYRAGSLNI